MTFNLLPYSSSVNTYLLCSSTLFTGKFNHFLIAIFLFGTFLTTDATSLPQLSDLVRARPHVFYTIARQYDSIEFVCNQRKKALLWILPNNQIVELNQTQESNTTIEFRESTIIVTTHTLKIPEIDIGFDGRYTCWLEDGEQFNFYVLQVSPRLDFSKAAVLSITASFGLALICLTVVFLDRYCSRPGAAVRPASMRPNDQAGDPMLYRRWF